MLFKSALKLNVVANFGGQIWITLIGILVVPIYLRYLSVELYGIIGIFLSLQILLSVFDVGLSPTLNREMARLSAFPDKAQEMRDLTRTLEIPYWLLGILVGLFTFTISPFIAGFWVNSAIIPVEVIEMSFKLMSLGFVFQWTTTLYSGGFLGLQRQVTYNFINVICQTIRSVGSVLVLVFVSPTIQGFLIWQTIWSAVTAFIFVTSFWHCLPKTDMPARFRLDLLRKIWRFAAGMTGNSIVWLILTQTDKIILSKMLSLEVFGYYALANLLASTGLTTLAISISKAYYPQFSQFVALDDEVNLRKSYHTSCQILTLFLVPASVVLAFFSYQILILWTRNIEVASNAYLILSLMAVGYGLNGLILLPSNMQWAKGLTKLYFWQNLIGIILLVPFMIYTSLRYGAIGGPICWVVLNILYVSLGMIVMHRLILKNELKKWYLEDVGLTTVAVVFSIGLIRYFYPSELAPTLNFILLILISLFAMTISLLTTAMPRKYLYSYIIEKKNIIIK